MTATQYYILSGKKNRMFTLWRKNLLNLDATPRYVCNLSNDRTQASAKAQRIAGKSADIVFYAGDLEAIRRSKFDGERRIGEGAAEVDHEIALDVERDKQEEINRNILRDANDEKRLEEQRDTNEKRGHGRITVDELRARWDAEKELADPVPEGRAEITGIILKAENRNTVYGDRPVMTVKASEGYVVWGSIPRSCSVNLSDLKGMHVTFTATIQRSCTDDKFGFFKRPTKAVFSQNSTSSS